MVLVRTHALAASDYRRLKGIPQFWFRLLQNRAARPFMDHDSITLLEALPRSSGNIISQNTYSCTSHIPIQSPQLHIKPKFGHLSQFFMDAIHEFYILKLSCKDIRKTHIVVAGPQRNKMTDIKQSFHKHERQNQL